MNRFFFIGFLILSCALPPEIQAATSQFGRYIGTLTHKALEKEQLAKIDFVSSRSEGNEIELKAVLTLHFGDFVSGEYVAYHFDKAHFNLISGSLVLDQSDSDITVVTKKFGNGELVAEVRSSNLGEVGELRLKLNSEATPKLPLIESVSGEYTGQCRDDSARGRLQLHTMRSIEDSSRVGNAFGAYDIKGQFGFENDVACAFRPGRACQKLAIENASYNFFSGEMILVGDLQTWTCRVEERGLTCDNGCRLERSTPERASRSFKPPQAAPAFTSTEPVLENPVLPIAGSYQGFVHNEYLNSYQPVQLNLVTYQASEDGNSSLKISAVANLFFGESKSEFIAYRFAARDYPRPLARPQFLLSRSEEDVDAFLKITSIHKGVVQGEWHSLVFGRVGIFEVRRAEAGKVTLAAGAKSLTSITASYEAKDFEMNLRVFQNRTPPNTENPFFPLDIGGWFRLRAGGAREGIQKGSYDFYTGKFGFQRSDSRWTIGQRINNETFLMRSISNVYGSILQEFNQPQKFKIKNPHN